MDGGDGGQFASSLHPSRQAAGGAAAAALALAVDKQGGVHIGGVPDYSSGGNISVLHDFAGGECID